MKKNAKKKFHAQVAVMLAKEFREEAEVHFQDMIIKIKIPLVAIESGLGAILLRIEQLVEKYFPERKDDIALLIRDGGSRYENVFKIWRPVA
ncbi:hypothetical protein AAFN85_08685 [Mucilaginibacter sp. CAU 1740]|uniref:hypothetical protein n=1 Tax=Mucilaginibacter sp. CAU 1740 TaxID=3140365 RepID=UPI00325A79AF